MFDFLGQNDNPDDKFIKFGNAVINSRLSNSPVGSGLEGVGRLSDSFQTLPPQQDGLMRNGSPMPKEDNMPTADKEMKDEIDEARFGDSFKIASNSDMLQNQGTPTDDVRVKNGQQSGIWGIIKALI